MDKKERVSIYIDGSNFYNNIKLIKRKNERVNYAKLITLLAKDREIISIFYYVAPLDKQYNYQKYLDHGKFLNFLRQIPKFNVVLCELKKEDKAYGIKEDDVHLAVDLVGDAYENKYDTAIIVSGDADFLPAIKRVKKINKKVENAYFRSSSAYKLRNTCNSSIKLYKLVGEFMEKKDS
ncbi:MAG: NYN domain-containing protein [Nanoarchaeota archaeon]|nr:NYN domain-containing protein [Nanoarchaeota archaeon]